MLPQNEIEVIKKYQALPKTLISRRLSEIVDEMLTAPDGEDFKVRRLFAIELRSWLKTIKLFSEAELNTKKDAFI